MKKVLCLSAALMAAGSANAAVIGIGDFASTGGGSYSLTTGFGSVSDGAVESFLGLSSGSLDALSTGNATHGSAISDTISVSAGDTFSFDWTWDSNESSATFWNDFAFVSLSLDGITLLADTFTPDNTSDTFSWEATSGGSLTWGVGVMDVNDFAVTSFVDVSNINVVSVPEPASIALLGLGLAGLGLARRKAAK